MRFPATRPLRCSFLALAAAVLALALTPAGSLAATHPLLGSFDGSETPAGSFAELGALAVDGTSGDVYATDIGNDAIDKFDASGHYLCQITGAGESSSSASECDKSAPGLPGGGFEFAAELAVGGEALEPQIAVDNLATGPERGDLYVATAGTVEEQALTPPASGDYTLSFEGETTASLTAEADAHEVEAALQALPAIGRQGAFVVPSAGHLLVHFEGRLVNTDIEQLTPSGGVPAASVATVRQGAPPRIERFGPAGALLGEVAELPGSRMAGLVAAGGEISVLTQSLESDTNFPAGHFVGHVTRFTTVGSPTGSFDTNSKSNGGFAVDSTADYYSNESGLIQKYSAGGSSLGRVRSCEPIFFACRSLATDLATDRLYLVEVEFSGQGEPGITEFSPQGEELGKFAQAQLASGGRGGIAVDPVSGTIYTASAPDAKVYRFATVGPRPTAPEVSEVKATAFEVTATINPEGAELTRCAFEYGTDTSYGQSLPCEQSPASIGAGATPVTVSAHLTGLTAGTVYHVRLAAANADGTTASADRSEETLAGPAIGETTASELTATSARLQARINPRGSDTHYRFEYGTDQSYGTSVPVPDVDIGAGSAPVTATQELQGLSAGTTYHYRVVAQSHCNPGDPTELCLSTGVDHTFVFLAAESPGPCPANELLRNENGSLLLPDCRAYEQVTPTFKNGALIEDVSFVGHLHEVASDGSRVIASSIQCFAGSQSCPSERGNAIGSPFSFERTATGWQTTPLALPGQLFTASSVWSYYAGTGTALFSATTPPGEEDDFYVRHPDGSLGHVGPVTPPAGGPQGPAGNGRLRAATADGSHVLWTLGRGEPQWPVDPSPPGTLTVYEYVGTENQQPFLVGVSGDQGSTDLISNCGTSLGGTNNLNRTTLSADGRVVVFTAIGHPGCFGTGANVSREVPADTLYARVDGESAAAHTVALSARSPGDCTGACLASPPAAAQFATAATDGSKVYFTSTQQLTDEASEDETQGDSAGAPSRCAETHGPSGCNLYLYDFGAPAGHELTDVSAAPEPRVQGVVGASSDGSRLYFVAKGLLAGENAAGRSPVPGGANLYLYERNQAHPAGELTFVATLAAADSELWEFATSPANVTPDGRFLVFTSHARLTPDDTSLSGAQQVFRYDAVARSLVRVSVGRRGFDDNGNRSAPSPCEPAIDACSEDATIAFSSPNATVSDDGSYVFFMSPVGLTPGALDDRRIGTSSRGLPVYAQNVYEWHEGEVSLISDGKDVTFNNGGEASCQLSSVCLLGTDASGHDVFFATADALTPSDTNTQLDYYDARVGGGFPPPGAETECQSDACKGPGSQANEPASPASAGFNGPAEGPAHPQQRHKKKHKHRKKRGKHNRQGAHTHAGHAKHRGGNR